MRTLNEILARKPSPPVTGVPLDDLTAILRALAGEPDSHDKRVLGCYFVDGELVVVKTGEWRGPLAGGGSTFLLKKSAGGWAVIEHTVWC